MLFRSDYESIHAPAASYDTTINEVECADSATCSLTGSNNVKLLIALKGSTINIDGPVVKVDQI